MAQPRNQPGPTRARATETAAARWQRDRTAELAARREQDRTILPVNANILGMNPQAERALLGCCLIAFEAFEAATDTLTPDDFYEWRHRLIFQAISDCPRTDKGVIDVVMLNEQLKRVGELGEVGQDYTGALTNSVPNWDGYREYLRIVLECSLTRQQQEIGAALTQGLRTPQETMARLQAIEARRLRVLGGMSMQRYGVLASERTPQPIRWLWKRRLARGKLAIIDGDPGLGKGFLTLDLVARKSAGLPFPGEIERQPPAHCILITPEDDIDDTIIPRLIAGGADLTRITILNTIAETDPQTGAQTERSVTIPRDVPIIEQVVAETGAELLVIDPVMNCLDSGVKTAVDNEVRTALMPLKHLCTRTGLTGILVRHLNKSTSEKAMYRGGGSIAFTALCRTAFAVAEHPDNPARRVFLPVKNNISEDAPGLIYWLSKHDEDGIPWVSWELDTTQLHANDVLNTGTKQSAEAREVLAAMRSGAVQLPAKPSDIAAAMDDGSADEKFVGRISKRLARMAKSGLLSSPAYGLYSLPTSTTTMSNLSK